ncbi:adventurous gliding motility lipoprotein CglC [Hyalangium versicolor]|uniref:adventurous gliding motility lipoprotein CglC n=1 Tax=Hyalangium versicolor TaxID=2861190 RepID=UPI001CC96531|nr:adventurous gliding motility lipoprotein CglC [Hyalangium versicolor]
MSPRLVVLLSAALLASGCEVTTELGKKCVLVKKPSDEEVAQGIRSKPVINSEIAAGQDFISFGATDCEDLICVRDAEFVPEDTSPNVAAEGYCSQECVEGSTGDCEVTDTSVPDALKDRIVCRSLLLDQATLERLKRDDPVTYRRTFGETNSPYFCSGKLSSTAPQ